MNNTAIDLFGPSTIEVPTFGLVSDASCYDFDRTKERDGYFHGKTEWQVVDIATGARVKASPLYGQGTINIGEFCGIIDALRILHERGDGTTPVYSDSKIALSWVRKRRTVSKLPLLFHTREIIETMEVAADWLRYAMPTNPVLFWSNTAWGENPADYGRKPVTPSAS